MKIIFKQLIKLTLNEMRLFSREPVALFFTFIFPVFFFFLIMEVFIPAEAPKEIVVNQILPSLMVLVIATTAIFGVPPSIVTYRQIKFLKRLKGAPIASLTVLGSIAIANFIVTFLGIALLVAVSILAYDAAFDGNPIFFLAGFLLSFASLVAIFLFIPAIASSERTAIAISNIVLFPMMFFSGVFIPLDMLPDWVSHYISPFIPLTHAVELMRGLWLGTPLSGLIQEVFILLGVLCLGLIIAARTFRWE